MTSTRATLASDAVRAGRPAVTTSFRFHRPRGAFCGEGWCQLCEVVTADGRRRLACETPAGAPRSARPDLLRPLGRVAEAFPPWFYERRLLRPRRLRRLSLHALRHLTAAAPLPAPGANAAPCAFEEIAVAVAVVGAPTERPPAGAYVADLAGGRLAIGVYPDRTLLVREPGRLVAVRFERLVLATGSYERLPPVPGNDLPGVIGIGAAEAYGAAGALRPGLRIAAWSGRDGRARVEQLADRHGLVAVSLDEVAPRKIRGRRRVVAVETSRGRIACDLVVTTVRQPALELALMAGASAGLTGEGLPILALAGAPDWLEVVGAAAARASGVPDVPLADAAFACLCEDVRVGDLRACVAQGFDDSELVKRRTGAMTGPCQGKLCAATVLTALRGCGLEVWPTRTRAPSRPVALESLAAHG
jgi:bacterioferritin-associated ferredoxin